VSESSEEEEEFRTPPPDLMTMVIEGCTPRGMFPVTISLMMMTDNMLGNTPAPTCHCLRMMATWFGDNKDEESSDESLLDDLYVPALMVNEEVSIVPATVVTGGEAFPVFTWRDKSPKEAECLLWNPPAVE